MPEKTEPEEELEDEKPEAEEPQEDSSENAEQSEDEPADDEADAEAQDSEEGAEEPAEQDADADEPEAEEQAAEDADAEADAGEPEAADDVEEADEPAEDAAQEAEEPAPAEPDPEPGVPVTLVADGKADFKIVLPSEPTDVESFAALELAKYIEKVSTVAIETQEGADDVEKAIFVGGVSEKEMAEQGIENDGFVIDISPEAIRLFGGQQRGTLFAVYALLERIGCHWPIPGEDHEHTPHRRTIAVEAGTTLENPRFVVRGFVEDTNYVNHDDEEEKDRRTIDDIDFIDWLAKNRCNHFHFRAPEDVFELIHYELQQRGLGYETGGHVIPQCLPRELFDEHPGYFPMSTKGHRQRSGNVCVSNPDALDIVRENFLKYIESFSDATLVHFWGDDVRDGGWCCCEQCRELLPQDQYITVCNHIAEALEDKGILIDYIAYHDTIEADLTVEPHSGVVMLFAPRERSYGSSVGDPNCETNALYADALKQYVETFNGNVQIFEYYADAILFGSIAVPLQHVIAEDLDFYESLGVKRMETLMFGRYSWWAYPLNLYAFARLAWTAEADVEHVTRDFAQAMYGDAADPMRRVFTIVEEGMRQVATYGDIKHPWGSEVPLRDAFKRVRGAADILVAAREPMARARQAVEDTRMEPLVLSQDQVMLYTRGEVEGTATQIDGFLELQSAGKAEERLKAKYLRVAALKLRDAAGITTGGMDIIAEVDDEVKGQWGMTGLVSYHERLIAHLEKAAQDAQDSIPPEPEPEAEEAEAEAEDAEPEAEAEEAEAEAEDAEPEAEEATEENEA